MHNYAVFCEHYELDPDSDDARAQYAEYRASAVRFATILGGGR